jgi:hypothetical protein
MSAADVVHRYWAACDARDWSAFASTLASNVVYQAPQTRERVTGREAVVRFNAEFPGDWRLAVERVVGQGAYASSWIRFQLDGTEQPGLCFFDLDEYGLIVRINDFWPDPYEPPPGREHLVERY